MVEGEKMKNLYSKMHNLFSLSKTLRFELQPIGKTKENFEQYVLENDERKALAYPFVKKYCDEVHKSFISECLQNIDLSSFESELEEYFNTISAKEINNDELDKRKKNLRKIVSESFKKDKRYNDMLGEKMLSSFVKELYKNDEEAMERINEFNKFSTYFVGYHQTRENMYKNEAKHTAIAYRLIDENLPTFKNNMKLYKKFAEVCADKIQKIKEELDIDLNEFFTDIKQYSKCLTQKDIEKYNLAITGKILENGHKIQGLNEYVNLYNQQNKDKPKLVKFKVLYKQILGDTSSASFVLDTIENDTQAVELVKTVYKSFNKIIHDNNDEFIRSFKNLSSYDWEKIFVNNDTSLTVFSNQVYGDWAYITKLREDVYDKNYTGKAKVGSEKYNTNRDNELKKIKFISLNFIEDNAEEKGKIAEYFVKRLDEILKKIEKSYSNCVNVLDSEYNEKTLQNDKDKVEKIKNLLDSLKELQNFVKTVIPKTDTDLDLSFYNALNYEALTEIIPVYNKVRNYMTKKTYSEEKFKLNFNCPTLLKGWSKNQEAANLCILFKKDNLYYLGIMNNKEKIDFNNSPRPQNEQDIYEK